jgi:hypothetical protein
MDRSPFRGTPERGATPIACRDRVERLEGPSAARTPDHRDRSRRRCSPHAGRRPVGSRSERTESPHSPTDRCGLADESHRDVGSRPGSPGPRVRALTRRPKRDLDERHELHVHWVVVQHCLYARHPGIRLGRKPLRADVSHRCVERLSRRGAGSSSSGPCRAFSTSRRAAGGTVSARAACPRSP